MSSEFLCDHLANRNGKHPIYYKVLRNGKLSNVFLANCTNDHENSKRHCDVACKPQLITLAPHLGVLD